MTKHEFKKSYTGQKTSHSMQQLKITTKVNFIKSSRQVTVCIMEEMNNRGLWLWLQHYRLSYFITMCC